jgi:hypothetical protein
MIHLIKLAVGAASIAEIEGHQAARAETRGEPDIRRAYTRNKPVRPDAVDGSLYWVIQGVIRCRQKLLGFDVMADEEGRRFCLFRLAPELVPVMPTPRGPFQGWRYLKPEDAPPDLATEGELPPDAMLAELRELGLI